MSDPYVSCIVPTHNRVSLLRRALISVQWQTYRDLEIIVVDDASTDETAQMVAEYRDEDGRVIYVRNEKCLGGGGARNVGIDAAKGQFIAFLDDDDEWLPKKIETQMRYAPRYGMVGTRYLALRGSLDQLRRAGSFLTGVPSIRGYKEIDLSRILIDNSGMSPSSVLFNSAQLKEVGGFDETLSANQGRDMFIRFVRAFGPAVRIEKALVIQHQEHGLGRISDSCGERFLSMERVHDRYRDLMPRWLERYDKARLLLQRAKKCQEVKRRRRLEAEAWSCLSFKGSWRFVRLYANYVVYRFLVRQRMT